jgi:chromodomain-helicase-DNA-binding protein 1
MQRRHILIAALAAVVLFLGAAAYVATSGSTTEPRRTEVNAEQPDAAELSPSLPGQSSSAGEASTPSHEEKADRTGRAGASAGAPAPTEGSPRTEIGDALSVSRDPRDVPPARGGSDATDRPDSSEPSASEPAPGRPRIELPADALPRPTIPWKPPGPLPEPRPEPPLVQPEPFIPPVPLPVPAPAPNPWDDWPCLPGFTC